MLDRLDPKGGGDMGFAGSRTTDEHDVLDGVDELATMELLDQGFVDLARGKVKAGDILVGWEPSGLHLVSN